jgi:hypothetical protein
MIRRLRISSAMGATFGLAAPFACARTVEIVSFAVVQPKL